MKKIQLLGVALLAFIAVRPLTASAEVDKKAERLWRSKCGSCHGVDGKGDTDTGKEMGISDITSGAWQKEFSDEKIRQTVLNGLSREKKGKKQEMKALGDVLKPEQIDLIIAYLRTLAK